MKQGFQTSPRKQRGAIAIIVGLSMAVLVGFAGLALDGGRLYVTKTEVQNASDACALAASFELTGAPTISAAAFGRADAAARKVAAMNRVGFQAAAIANGDTTVTFGTTLAGGSWLPAGSATGNSKYVRCEVQQTGIAPWFMQVLGIGPQTVSALATASLVPSGLSSCPMPMALCTQPGGNAGNEYGYVIGNWYGLGFRETGGNANYTGNFRWVDFNPGSSTPGCSGGGAQELSCILSGPPPGGCTAPPPITGSCAGSSNGNPIAGCIGQTGNITSLQDAYNSRFGVYKNGGGLNKNTAPMDRSGYAYSTENWTLGRQAYSGASGGLPNFAAARAAHLRTQTQGETPTVNPPIFSNQYDYSSVLDHTASNRNRRIVPVPVVDCNGAGGFTSGQQAAVRNYACVLMLDTYRKVGPDVVTKLEYLGLASDPGSPCAVPGLPGGAASLGPLVPGLVQ